MPADVISVPLIKGAFCYVQKSNFVLNAQSAFIIMIKLISEEIEMVEVSGDASNRLFKILARWEARLKVILNGNQ